MDKSIFVLRGIDAVAFAAGMPLAPLVTKLFEELSDSNISQLVEISEAQALDKGFAFCHLRNGLMALNNFLDFEIAQNRRNRQLYRAAEEFEMAYFFLKRHSLYSKYRVKAACYVAGSHMLLSHPEMAQSWLQIAYEDNEILSEPESKQLLRGYFDELVTLKKRKVGE